jgi:hypothetical protein
MAGVCVYQWKTNFSGQFFNGNSGSSRKTTSRRKVSFQMIHYHGTPFSGSEQSHIALRAKHACVSFASSSCLPVVAELCQSFILDNGAFSAWKRGTTMDVDAFRTWSSYWSRHPGCDWFLIPDVIDGCEKENDELLDGWGPCGVPVWHMHESFDRLDRLVTDFQRVALGSSGEFATVGNRSWWTRMTKAMQVACDSGGIPRAKLHGLRMLDPTVFSHLPLSSADSTNVARNIGIDSAWDRAPYAPKSRQTRALLIMERIESHASASRWCDTRGSNGNLELFG